MQNILYIFAPLFLKVEKVEKVEKSGKYKILSYSNGV
jgi:hypothetical protein